MNYHGCTEEQVKRLLAIGLTPWQFENIKGKYYTGERGYAAHKEAVLKILEKRHAEGKPIPKPCYDHPNTMDNDSATFFWIAIMLIAIIFKERWIIWIFATVVYMLHMTRHERKNQKEFEEFKKQEENK